MPIGVTWRGKKKIFMFGDDFEIRGLSQEGGGKWVVEESNRVKNQFDPKKLASVIEQPNHDRVLMILENNIIAEYNFETRKQSIKMDLKVQPWDLTVLCQRIIQISEEYCAFIAGNQLVLCRSLQKFYTIQLRSRCLNRFSLI